MSTESSQGIDVSGDQWAYDQGLASLAFDAAPVPADDDPAAEEPQVGHGTPLDDLIQGTPDDEILIGLGGDDTVQSFAGHDHVAAGPGDDFIISDGGSGIVDAGSGDDYLHVSQGGVKAISLGDGADSLEFVAVGEGEPFGIHHVLDYDIFEDGPLSIVAYQGADDPGDMPKLDSNGDGLIDGSDLGVAVVDGTLIIDLSIAWYHDLSIGSSIIALDGLVSLPVDIIG